MQRFVVAPFLVLSLGLIASCRRAPRDTFELLSEEFVYSTLRQSPVLATASGYHVDNGIVLDELLDRVEPQEITRRIAWLNQIRTRLNAFDVASMPAEMRADHELISRQAELEQFDLEIAETWRHDPKYYAELVGAALFTPLTLEYAPREQRYQHIIARLNLVPGFLAQAQRNLDSAPVEWTKAAIRANDGNRDLISQLLAEGCPSGSRSAFDRARQPALEAIEQFGNWLTSDLTQRDRNWRLGEKAYAAKFNATMGLRIKPEELLAAAEDEIGHTRAEMHRLTGGAGDAQKSIAAALDRIAARHSKPEEYLPDAIRDLDAIKDFVRTKRLVPLGSNTNLQIIPTPGFMQPAYPVGGFNPAPPFSPDLGAFYWLTPIPTSMDPQRAESKLREYNYYGLQLLTIHEAVPGHALQFDYANAVQPPLRRALRSMFANGPYVEGWAVYATGLMVEAGYLNNDPQLKLTWLKQYLRAVANAILDIRMHTTGMTDEEALDLLIRQTFQEPEEAQAKLLRAKLTSAQLPTYFAGYKAWRDLRKRAETAEGGAFSLSRFHADALRPGAIPMPALERLILNR